MADIRNFEHSQPKIAEKVYLDSACIIIGDVVIGTKSSVWPGTVIRGDVHHISIGEQTNIQDGCVLHNSHDSEFMSGGSPLIIGNKVTIGHKVILHGCQIDDLCLIGMGAIVMDKAVIESEVILGAGSLVPSGKILESGYLYTGSPAKRVRALKDEEKHYLRYSAEHYVRLADRHLK